MIKSRTPSRDTTITPYPYGNIHRERKLLKKRDEGREGATRTREEPRPRRGRGRDVVRAGADADAARAERRARTRRTSATPTSPTRSATRSCAATLSGTRTPTPRGKTKREKRTRRKEVVAEIEKVKERRKEREAERAEFERLKLEQERLEQQDEAEAFFEKEQRFHEQQVYKRTLVRVGERRQQDVDLVAKNIVVLEAMSETNGEITGVHSQGSVFVDRFRAADMESRDALAIVESDDMDAERLGALVKGLGMFVAVERTPEWKQYWEDAVTLPRAVEALRDGKDAADGIHASVLEDVVKQLDGKTEAELSALQKEMQASWSAST